MAKFVHDNVIVKVTFGVSTVIEVPPPGRTSLWPFHFISHRVIVSRFPGFSGARWTVEDEDFRREVSLGLQNADHLDDARMG